MSADKLVTAHEAGAMGRPIKVDMPERSIEVELVSVDPTVVRITVGLDGSQFVTDVQPMGVRRFNADALYVAGIWVPLSPFEINCLNAWRDGVEGREATRQ